jgi:hypothetical protein
VARRIFFSIAALPTLLSTANRGGMGESLPRGA